MHDALILIEEYVSIIPGNTIEKNPKSVVRLSKFKVLISGLCIVSGLIFRRFLVPENR